MIEGKLRPPIDNQEVRKTVHAVQHLKYIDKRIHKLVILVYIDFGRCSLYNNMLSG